MPNRSARSSLACHEAANNLTARTCNEALVLSMLACSSQHDSPASVPEQQVVQRPFPHCMQTPTATLSECVKQVICPSSHLRSSSHRRSKCPGSRRRQGPP